MKFREFTINDFVIKQFLANVSDLVGTDKIEEFLKTSLNGDVIRGFKRKVKESEDLRGLRDQIKILERDVSTYISIIKEYEDVLVGLRRSEYIVDRGTVRHPAGDWEDEWEDEEF